MYTHIHVTCVYVYVYGDKILLCNSGWPWTFYPAIASKCWDDGYELPHPLGVGFTRFILIGRGPSVQDCTPLSLVVHSSVNEDFQILSPSSLDSWRKWPQIPHQ